MSATKYTLKHSFPRRPASYRCIELYGTAQNVIHPLQGS